MKAELSKNKEKMDTITTTQTKKKFIQTSTFGVSEYELKPQGAGYKPRISPEHLSKLWRLKLRTQKPITKLVAEALDLYFYQVERG